jgi:hypothetical protein
MPANLTPVKGKFCKLTDNTSPTALEYPGVNWTLNDDAKLDDVSNFRDGRRRIDTLKDATLEFELIYDENDAPDKSTALNLQAGVKVTVKAYVNNAQTKFWEFPGRIATISTGAESKDKANRYKVKLELDGTLVYPVWT